MPKLKKLPDDCTFPQLAVVLDESRFAAMLQSSLSAQDAGFAARSAVFRGLKLKRVYYKPGRSCRITFVAKMQDGESRGEQFYFAKIVTDSKLDSTYARARRGRLTPPAFGPPVALVRELSMILWAYPNDPNLPGLSLLADGDAVSALLRRDPSAFGMPQDAFLLELRSGLGKYVPGQRCGYRYRAQWRLASGRDVEQRFYGKAYQPGLGQPAYDILVRLAATDACRSGALRIPAAYGFDAEHDIVWQELLPGASFSKEASARDLQAHAGPVARALGAFHATRLELVPGLGLSQEIEALQHAVRKLAKAYPQHAALCAGLERRLLDAVPALPAVPPSPVHGSFKISHIFDAEGQVAFIDFDGAGIGDPTYDVGRFMAHLAVAGMNAKLDAASLEAAVRHFRDAYAGAVPWAWPEARVRWYTSALLISSQAYKCVKRMAPDRVETILRCAEAWFPAPAGGA